MSFRSTVCIKVGSRRNVHGSDIRTEGRIPVHTVKAERGQVPGEAQESGLTPEDWVTSALDRPAWECWGKGQPGGTCPAHPLLCHFLDVAAVAHHLLTTHAPLALRRQLLALMPEDEGASLKLLLYIIALHDLGKFTPAFQTKLEWANRLLTQRGFDLDPPATARHHGAAGLGFVRDALHDSGVPSAEALALARAVTAHHGEFPTNASLNLEPMGGRERGRKPRWDDARRDAVESLRSFFGVEPPISLQVDHAYIVRLAGLTAVADWIGSMEAAFPYEPPQSSLESYWPRANDRARDALRRVGMRPYAVTPPRSFQELFPALAPWPLHRAAGSLAAEISSPSLIVVEAPMGEGKTEAALLLANAAAASLGQQGTYIGLPTKATANQMLGRVRVFLEHTRPDARSSLVLAHGDSDLVEEFRSLVAVYDDGGGPGGVRAEEWFLSKKRTLLAEYAVGTIDQALLGVLRTRHSFVRLYGLAGKTVILDEVHAYDTFTSTILERLIEWLAALGTTVVLLSATLPRTRRLALLTAYRRAAGGTTEMKLEEVPYPRLTTVTSAGGSSASFAPRGDSVTVKIERVGTDVTTIAMALIEQLRDGGCVGWICNTVHRAQEAYKTLARLDPDLPRLLIHARMLPEDRTERERRLESLLGPESRGSQRPERQVVVGTQVLEQSLDVDFDLLVTDLAPVDLLLQRAGRLHRHRDRGNRSVAHPQPRLWLVHPHGTFDSVPIRGVAEVYAEALVRGTLRALEGRTIITLPDDIEPLVEEVYRATLPATGDELFGAYIDLFGGAIAQRQNAGTRLLPKPTDEDDIFGNLRMPFSDDEDPRVHGELLAITRDAERSVQVVCLVGRGGRLYVSENGVVPVSFEVVPDRALAAKLALRTISVSNRRLVPELLADQTYLPERWQVRALLRHRRAVVFTDCVATVAGIRLELDPEIGLTIASPTE